MVDTVKKKKTITQTCSDRYEPQRPNVAIFPGKSGEEYEQGSNVDVFDARRRYGFSGVVNRHA